MPDTAVYLDDYDLAGIRFTLENITGWRSIPPRRGPTAQLAAGTGDIHLTTPTEQQYGPRRIMCDGLVRGATIAEMESFIDELSGRLEQVAVFRAVDQASREVNCRLGRYDRLPNPRPPFDQRAARVRFELFCADPVIRATTDENNSFFPGPTDMEVGTFTSLPVITIVGAVTNPVITYKDYLGVTQGTLGLTYTNAGGQTITIDCENFTIVHSVAGNIIDALTSGDFIVLDPRDADPWATVPDWPTLEIAPTPGTSCAAVYPKRWIA